MLVAKEVVVHQRSRGKDKFGHGQFGASRDGGSRAHQGLDILCTAGEKIFSPIDGVLVRESVPYKNDRTYRGIVIQGTGPWAGYEVKIFYAEGLFSGPVRGGQHVAFAQDLNRKYPGIKNHVHIEVRLGGHVQSPSGIFAQCF